VLPLSSQAKGQHLIDANLAAAGLMAGAVPRLTVPGDRVAAARRRLDPLGRRIVAVQAGSSLTHRWFRKQANLKGLTPRQWADLLAGILAADEADGAILLGSAPEGREARAIRAALPAAAQARVHDWTGQVGLLDLPAVLSACSACISVDTGPAHIAAAVGCPLLAIFGPTNPQRFLPRGPGRVELLLGSAPCQFCHGTPLFRTCADNICLSRLEAGNVRTAWRRLISPAGTPRPPVADTPRN
jgi:ADP-heptose:LPS heptosyltransferase